MNYMWRIATKKLILWLGITQTLDVIFTEYLLKNGMVEINPVADLIITSGGFSSLLAVKMLAILFVWVNVRCIKSRIVLLLLSLAVVVYTLLNIYQLWSVLK